MEQTITQSGALFTAQHKRARRSPSLNGHLSTEPPVVPVFRLRTTVGEFSLRPAQFGYQLEVKVEKLRRPLGVYETPAAAVLALRNRQSRFQPWDLMGRNAVAIQIDTVQRWHPAEAKL